MILRSRRTHTHGPDMRCSRLPLLLLLMTLEGGLARGYVGRALGALSELHHGVRGRVFAVDSRTLYLQDFSYDGEGPAAFFYAGWSGSPGAGGTRLRDERGGAGALRKYRGESFTLSLPEGRTLKDLRWLAVWCDEYSVNFGSVSVPAGTQYPRPARAGALRGVHGVQSDPLVVVDAQTILVPNFSYDGEAPDAKFWVGRGDRPSSAGLRIPDENGKEAPLRKYDRKTIVLTLPGELTVFDIGHVGVWCEAFTVDFGHVVLPRELVENVPPSLKMLGVSPQSKLNCEVLADELAFEVRWAVAGDSIVLQLVAKLEEGEYMSFGVSGSPSRSQMVGGDVAVAWVDKSSLKGFAQDYYLDAKSQCAGVRGSCPDERLGEKTNSVRLLNAALVNGYSIVTYQRALRASDELDRAVLTNGSQPVIWAVGPLNARDEVSYHHHYTKGDRFLEFGRAPVWNCPMPEGEDEPDVTSRPATSRPAAVTSRPVPTPAPAPRVTPWEIPAIQCNEPPDGVFYAQMGPTGGKQGYPAITGHVGWGIAWYINGLLIPELVVVRGRRYTFVVEGGADPAAPASYHPFYITDDPVGGYHHKTDEEKKAVRVFAGVRRTRGGALAPSGAGRLCTWTPDPAGPPPDDYPSFGAYQRALTLVCEEGSPGLVTWTPDADTPDTVYYQCFTHRYLGWRIRVVDDCDEPAQESRVRPVAVPPPPPARAAPPASTSEVQHASGAAGGGAEHARDEHPQLIAANAHYDGFSSDTRPENEPPPVTHGQIRDVIRAVETLETRMKQGMRRPPAPTSTPHHHDEHAGLSVRTPDHQYFLPRDERPLTLQSVLRPAPRRPPQPARRPPPPDLHSRRPPPHARHPLPTPNLHRRPPTYKRPVPPAPQNLIVPPRAPTHSQTLSLGRTELVADQVVRSRITTQADSAPAPSSTHERLAVPTQIILGTPVEHPVPLEQHAPREPPRPEPPRLELPRPEPPQPEPPREPLPAAINTGFQPNTIVVESGFKPIIREPLMSRVPDYEDAPHRRHDTDETDYSDLAPLAPPAPPPQPLRETFEPMFIPSPPDQQPVPAPEPAPASGPAPAPVPPNHAHEDRPYPVYVQPDLTAASDRVSPQYLPPAPAPAPAPAQPVYTAYDGSSVPAAALVPLPTPRAPTPHPAAGALLQSPQFGPFTGDVPPLQAPGNHSRTTHLAPLQAVAGGDHDDDGDRTRDRRDGDDDDDDLGEDDAYEDDDDESTDDTASSTTSVRVRRDTPPSNQPSPPLRDAPSTAPRAPPAPLVMLLATYVCRTLF